ncbi:MAG: transglycosylase SLT domain-containing protein [Bacteroides sp.]|nr:transglycosylase SLT domain-containing protein [Roseburia sp.]MCM1345752.1 transglycosylase SLT domain-containing protein [Bacteroides sp.]MCM1420153.1 transglycosylase SLT domain-containing protein [Bacteroides sp.]
MNKTFIIVCVSSLITYSSMAQEIVTDSGRVEAIDMPEGLIVSEEELLNDYINKNNLTVGSGEVRVLSYDDSIIVNRLSKIPTTIEMPFNDVTQKFIERYCNKMRASVAVMLGSSNFYMPIFEEALERYGLPLELRYLPVIESALRPSATSRVGAAGLWQFMITTGKRYGLEVNTLVDERRDPVKSSDAAARYLRDLYGMFGDWGLAIAAYNCGEGNVQKALLRSGDMEVKDFWSVYNRLPRETRGYVPAFIAANYIMTYYCDHGIVPMEAHLPAQSDTIVVTNDVQFKQISSVCNITVDELRALNPQYRHDIVPMNYSLRLPSQSIEAFILNEDSIYGLKVGDMVVRRSVTEDIEGKNVSSASTKKRNGSTAGKTVSVRNGDSLSTIAKRNGTTVARLKKLNGLRGNMIHPGQKLRVK